MLAAEVLQRLGYRNVVSVRGGTLRWTADGFPLTRPDTDVEIDHDFHDRYSRHLLLPEIGMRGQRRLELARVLMIGAGGLGAADAVFLAAAGARPLGRPADDVVAHIHLRPPTPPPPAAH